MDLALQIEEGRSTPYICFDPDNNHYYIRGKCFPENSKKFFEPVVDWVKECLPKKDVSVTVELDYLSSSSNIALVLLFKAMQAQIGESFYLSVVWRYEIGDDEGLKTGESLSEAMEHEFIYESYQDTV